MNEIFYPEWLECRDKAVNELRAAGFELLTHYSSVKALQDCHGLEIRGITSKVVAVKILALLEELFPTWNPSRIVFLYRGEKAGWSTTICRESSKKRDEQASNDECLTLHYFVCSSCGAKFFALPAMANCSRCGLQLLSSETQQPPWRRRRWKSPSESGQQRQS